MSFKNMKAIRHLSLLLYSVFALMTCDVHAAQPSDSANMIHIDWPLEPTAKQVISVDLPRSYGSDTFQTYNGKIVAQLFIKALWPTLESRNNKNLSDFNVIGGGRYMNAQLMSGARRLEDGENVDTLELIFGDAIERTKTMCIFNITGSNCYPLPETFQKKPLYGLERVGVDFGRFPGITVAQQGLAPKDVLYYKTSDGALQDFIECYPFEDEMANDRPPPGVSPQCSQYFIYQPMNAVVHINYREIYLPEWRKIRATWEELLGSFISSPAKQ